MFWYSYTTLKQGKISDDKLRDQAKEIGKEMKITDFNYSFGWLSKFKKRYKLHKSYIDKCLVEIDMPTNVTQLIEWVKEVHEANLNESDLISFVENNQSLNESNTAKKEAISSGDSCSNDDYISMNSVDLSSTTSKEVDLNDAKIALEKLHKFCEQSEYFDSNDLRFLIRLKSKLESIN